MTNKPSEIARTGKARQRLGYGMNAEDMDLIEKLKTISATLADPELTMRLFEDSPDAVIIVNHEGRIQLINKQAEFLFGYHRSELFGKPVEILIPEDLRTLHEEHRASFMDDPRTRPMGLGIALKGLTKAGRTFDAEINLSPIVTQSGSFVAATIRKRRQ